MKNRRKRGALLLSVSLALSLSAESLALAGEWDESWMGSTVEASRAETWEEAPAWEEEGAGDAFVWAEADSVQEESPWDEEAFSEELVLSPGEELPWGEDFDLPAAEEALEEDLQDFLVGESASSLVKNGIILYALGSDWEWDESYPVPSGYPQSYDLSEVFGDEAVYSVVGGYGATVNKSGLVSPVRSYTYWNDGIPTSYSSGLSTESMTYVITPGDTLLEVRSGSKVYQIKVTVKNYATYAAQKEMDDYIKAGISSSMSDYEKLAKLADYPCQYYYYTEHDTYEKMILLGGGNRNAVCEALLYLCEKAGLSARSFYYGGEYLDDPSGRRCVLAMAGGRSYVVDFIVGAGAVQYYAIRELSASLFRYEAMEDETLTITGYYGAEPNLVLPTKINGVSVTAVSYAAFAGATYLKSIKLPTSIVDIGDYAFANCQNLSAIQFSAKLERIGEGAFLNTALTSFTLPATCEYVGEGAFRECSQLTAIQTASGNPVYASLEGVLYEEDYEILHTFPAGKAQDTFFIPSTVRTLASFSLAGLQGVKDIVVPMEVQQVLSGCFEGNGSVRRIWFAGNAPSLTTEVFGVPGLMYQSIQVYVPRGNVTWDAYKAMDFNGLSIYWRDALAVPKLVSLTQGDSGPVLAWRAVSGAPEYLVLRKGGTGDWEAVGRTAETSYTDTDARADTYYAYTVRCVSTDGETPLSLYDEDGLVLENAVPPATAGITIAAEKAVLYTGSVAAAYRKLSLSAEVSGIEGTVKYKSSDKTVATVSKNGVVKPVAKGSATITAYVKTGNKTYKAKCKVTVKNPSLKLSPASLALKVGESAWAEAKVTPAKSVKWTSKDDKVTITSEGLVTARQKGTTYIYGKANGIKKKVKVIISEAE